MPVPLRKSSIGSMPFLKSGPSWTLNSAAIHEEIRSATRGGSLADHLSTAVSFRLAAILGASGLELDEKALAQLRALLPLSQTIVKMRQGEFAAARLRIKNSAT